MKKMLFIIQDTFGNVLKERRIFETSFLERI